MRQQEKAKRFVDGIWRWYAKNKRRLPWRDLQISDDAQRAYVILVSEVMLQQTQVPRVQVLFPRFLQKFPTIHDLAWASNREMLIAWRGMGYNSRALRLRDAARVIGERGFPRSMEELQKIPGIGPYTAAAIRNFAFGIPTPCVDVNIGRILRRVFGMKEKKVILERAGGVMRVALESDKRLAVSGQRTGERRAESGERQATKLPAARCPLPAPPSAAWHSALMDFGSAVCTKRSPKCTGCPLSKGICCSAFRRRLFAESSPPAASRQPPREPGRIIAGRFIPNRIIRGKIVDLLRDHPQGLTLARIGRASCSDWSAERRPWLRGLCAALRREAMIEQRGGRYLLPECGSC